MLTFTPDGLKVLVASEGEPSGDYATDPEGSVSIIDISEGEAGVTQVDLPDFWEEMREHLVIEDGAHLVSERHVAITFGEGGLGNAGYALSV